MADHYHKRRGERRVRFRSASEIYQLRADVIYGRVFNEDEILELLEELDAYVDLYRKGR